MDTRKIVVIGGTSLVVALYLAGMAVFTYIGYLIILALKKYVGA